MDKKLIEFIHKLSISDTKTLSQKTLKACEEVGELAKVVLPFENAFACKHRFVDRRAILEEVADVMLTVMSVAYNLGFGDSDLEEMIKEKSFYWAELQNRDRDAKFPVPFEIHITVQISNEYELTGFKKDCIKTGVKPLLLDLQNTKGISVMQEVMTSSLHIGSNFSVYSNMSGISHTLKELGYKVIREKIETVPWHPAVPSNKHANPIMPKDCYFESHLAIVTTETNLPKLQELVAKHNCHLSKNIFKRIDENYFKIMATFRKYDGVFEDFKDSLETIKKDIIENGFEVEKTIIEFSIYDSKVSHDASWLKAKGIRVIK